MSRPSSQSRQPSPFATRRLRTDLDVAELLGTDIIHAGRTAVITGAAGRIGFAGLHYLWKFFLYLLTQILPSQLQRNSLSKRPLSFPCSVCSLMSHLIMERHGLQVCLADINEKQLLQAEAEIAQISAGVCPVYEPKRLTMDI